LPRASAAPSRPSPGHSPDFRASISSSSESDDDIVDAIDTGESAPREEEVLNAETVIAESVDPRAPLPRTLNGYFVPVHRKVIEATPITTNKRKVIRQSTLVEPQQKKKRTAETISAEDRVHQFPGESFIVNEGDVYCEACKTSIANDSHTLKKYVMF
jgi:hypothetical protein